MSVPVTIDLLPAEVNWNFLAGATWEMNATYNDSTGTPVNLTSYTSTLMVRETIPATTTIISISTTPNTQGSITLPAPLLGELLASVVDTATALTVLPDYTPKRFEYDWLIESPAGIVTPIMRGAIRVEPGVTR